MATDDTGEDDPLSVRDMKRLKELNEKDEDELTDAEVTSKIKLSVKRRYDPPVWQMVFEFTNRDGRRCDALALSTSPSRNFKLVGFEFKASRSDWLSEKKNHEKADLFVQLMDEWYVVAGRRGIVEEAELPDGWGLLELKPSGRLYNLVESDLNEMQETEPDRRFWARFIKKSLGGESNFTRDDIREAKRRGVQEAKIDNDAEKLDHDTRRLKRKADAYDRLRDSDLDIYTRLNDDTLDQLSKAHQVVKALEDGRTGGLARELERFDDNARQRFNRILGTVESVQGHVSELQEMVGDADGWGENGIDPETCPECGEETNKFIGECQHCGFDRWATQEPEDDDGE